ncbi:MAG: hypothetical protein HFG26_03825 [Provencibacterium sp.]|nr:hypothetical protein [Provencibacterium sp.]
MKRPTLTDGFRLLAAAYWLLLLFPFLNLAGALAEGRLTSAAALYGQGSFLLLAGCGYLLPHFLSKHRLLLGLLRPFAVLLAAGAGFLISPFAGWIPRTLFALLCGAALLAGTLFCGLSYADFRAGRPLVWLLVFHALAAALLWVLEKWGLAEYRLDMLVLSLALALAFYALCRNQANIDFHMERRRHRLELLPQKIRVYNLMLMLGIFVSGFCLFLLRRPIAEGLRALGWRFLGCLAWIFFLLVKLIERLFPKEETAPSSGFNDPDILALFQDESYESIPDFWIYLATALIIAALLWWKRREILRLFCLVFQKLAELIRRLFSFHPSFRALSGEEENPYYTDEVVSLPPEERNRRPAARRFHLREWKKSYRQYLHMPEDTEERRSEKFRYGYRLVLQYLAGNGRYLSGETVHELERRVADLPFAESYPAAAKGYDSVRYGERAPSSEDFVRLQRVLTGIAGRSRQ